MPLYRNEWIPVTPLSHMENKEYDVLIVGSGAGGGAALWRLCQQFRNRGKKIGLVEAGDLLLPTHGHNIPTLNSGRLLTDYFPKVSTPIGKSLPQYSGAVLVHALGGKTLFWTGGCPRFSAFEMKDWPIHFQDLNKYYTIAEKIMTVTKKYTQESSLQNVLLDRLRQSGFSDAEDLPIAVNLQPTVFGKINSSPFFSSIHFLAHALSFQAFDLAVNARVAEVYVENAATVGLRAVSLDNSQYFLRAKTIILAASAFETPRILLNSDIKGHAFGLYLTNHSILRASGRINRAQFSEELGNLAINIPQSAHAPIQIQIFGPGPYYAYQPFEEKSLKEEVIIAINGFGKVESRRENRIFLDRTKQDAHGVPLFQVDFSNSEKDYEVINEAARGIMNSADAMNVSLMTDEINSPIQLMQPGNDYHESGTCRMGWDPFTSVTDSFGQVHGYTGLFIADNSVLPSIGAANPTLTTVSLAIRTADFIVQYT